MHNTTTFVIATLSNVRSYSHNTNIRNNTTYSNNSVITPTAHFNNNLSTTNYNLKNFSHSSLSSHNFSPKHVKSTNYHFSQNYHSTQANNTVTKSSHNDSKNREKASNNNSSVNLQQKGNYSTSLHDKKSKKYKGLHHNKHKNSEFTSSNDHKKGQQKYKGYDLGKYIKDDFQLFWEEKNYPTYNSSHVRNKREDIGYPKNPARYAPDNSSVITEECFPPTAVCAPPAPQQSLNQYTLDFGRFGTFNVRDSYYGNRTAVKEHMQIAIDKVGIVLGDELLNNPVRHECTLNLNLPLQSHYVWDQVQNKYVMVYYGESGVYEPYPVPSYDKAQVIRCNMRASLHPNTDFLVLEHEMAHAIINAILQGKMDSMPRFFTEGIATVIMHYNLNSSLRQQYVDDAHNKVVQHDWKNLPELLNFLQSDHAHHYNYLVGEVYLLFCNHKAPAALREYVDKIINESFKSTFAVPVKDFIGIKDLAAECGMDDFKQWLKNPDISKGSYNTTNGNTATSTMPNKPTSDSKDLVLICNSKYQPKAYVCDQQQHFIKTMEDYIGASCSVAKGNENLRPNDHITFSYGNNMDRNDIIVIELQQDGFTFTRATYNSLTKHDCKGWHDWLQHDFIKPILDVNSANDCNELDVSYFIKEMQRCLQVPVTPADYNMFPQDASTAHASEDTTKTPWLKIGGGLFAVLITAGPVFGLYKCINNKKKPVTKNEHDRGEEIELTTIKTDEQSTSYAKAVLESKQHLEQLHQQEIQHEQEKIQHEENMALLYQQKIQHEQNMLLIHKQKIQNDQKLQNMIALHEYTVGVNGDNNSEDWDGV